MLRQSPPEQAAGPSADEFADLIGEAEKRGCAPRHMGKMPMPLGPLSIGRCPGSVLVGSILTG